MNINWIKVFIAGFFEVTMAIGLKHADGLWGWAGTVASIVIGFCLMISASKKLPVGTVYAVFVGLGTAGTVLSEMLLFGESLRVEKVLLIALLLAGVIGLKLITDDKTGEGAES